VIGRCFRLRSTVRHDLQTRARTGVKTLSRDTQVTAVDRPSPGIDRAAATAERKQEASELGAAGKHADRTGRRFRGPKPDFEDLYADNAPQLLAFLIYRTGDRGIAEDLLADTFERVLRAKRGFDPRRGSEKTWLYAIALNCLRDNARKLAAEARALERSGGRADGLDGHQRSHDDGLADRDFVREGLAALSDEERLVVSLRYGADLTMPELARLLGQPVTTVEARVYRALVKLRARIAD
jgi:RNA polymerase sigma factor (sigma-70 family)